MGPKIWELVPWNITKNRFLKNFRLNKKRSFLRIWSHLLKKSLMENFIFCAVLGMNFSSGSMNHAPVDLQNVYTIWRICIKDHLFWGRLTMDRLQKFKDNYCLLISRTWSVEWCFTAGGHPVFPVYFLNHLVNKKCTCNQG